MRPILTTLLLLGTAAAPIAAQAAPSWSGTYIYDEDGGRTAGGTAILITHTLQLWNKNGAWTGRLESNGYQTYINTVVSGKPRANRMDILFKSRSAETISPQAKRGDRLFTLIRLSNGTIITNWGVFWPVSMERAPLPGTYFKRKTVRQ